MKKNRKLSWFLKIGIHLICVLIFFSPLAYRYIHHEGGKWETILVYQDSVALLIMILFYFFWVLYSLVKTWLFKNITRILLLGIGGLIVLFNFAIMGMPIQDSDTSVPGIGAFAMCSLFPSLALLFIVEIYESRKREDESLENILDA